MFNVMEEVNSQFGACESWKRSLEDNDSNNFTNAFDFGESQYPSGILKDHFIIFGRIDG